MKSIKSFLTESEKVVEPTFENLIKALKISAKAHRAEFEDWSDEGQLGIESETTPVVADVYSICEAFFGNHDMVEVNYGYTTVWLGHYDMLPKVNMMKLMMALPHGTKF